jgi:hypothetical protein
MSPWGARAIAEEALGLVGSGAATIFARPGLGGHEADVMHAVR